MTAAGQRLETVPPHLSAIEAAARLGISLRRVQQLCGQRWADQGLARKHRGEWIIHPAAHPKLGDHCAWRRGDLEQVALLRSEGIRQEHLALAERRRDILLRFDAFEGQGNVPERFPKFVAALTAEGVLPCQGIQRLTMTSTYRWRKAYREDGIRGLVPQFGKRGRKAQRVGENAWAFFQHLILGGNGIGVAQAYRLTLGEIQRHHRGEPGWEWPSQAVIERRARERIGQGLRTVANKGLRAFDAGHVPKARRDVQSIASCEEWDGDERTLDVMVRAWTSRGWQPRRGIILTAWRDMRSRTVVGHRVATYADSNTILGSLKLAIRRFGKPRLLRVDWGRDYRKATEHIHTKRWQTDGFDGPRIGGILDGLGIEVRPVMPYHPQSKPIESWFRTLKEHCDKTFASFWGGSPAERHEDRDRWVREHLDELPTLEDVCAAVDRFIEDFNNTPHSAPDMFGFTPLYAMERFRDGPARMESDAVLEFLFGEFVGPKLVRRDGIRYLNEVYGFGDSRVMALQGKKVWLCVQPDDVRTILLCDQQRRPLFHVESGNNVIRSKRDLQQHVKMRARVRRGGLKQAREARRFFLGISPQEHLENHAAGVAALHGRPPRPRPAPRLAAVRPELEEALQNAAPAPLEAASKAVRDEDEASIELLDLVDGEPVERPSSSVRRFHEDEEDNGDIAFEDLIGENP